VSLNPNPAIAAMLAQIPADGRNPFDVLLFLMMSVGLEMMPIEKVAEIAGSLELAQLATNESTQQLAAWLHEIRERHGRDALFPAQIIRSHTIALCEFGRYALALALQDVIRTIYSDHGDPRSGAVIALIRANTLQLLGRYEEALRGYESALAVYEAHGLEIEAAQCRENRAATLLMLGWYEEALRGYESALAVYEMHGLEIQAAQCRENRAATLLMLGWYEEALRGYESALAVYEKHGLEIQAARCRNNRAGTLRKLNRNDEAVVEYERVLTAFRNPGVRGKVTGNLAKALWTADRRVDAFARATESRTIYRGARRTAGIDENHLEYLTEANRSVQLAVQYATALDLPVEAFEAAQDGKAAVVGDLMRQLTHAAPADPRLTAMRGDLVALLDQRAATREEARGVRARTRDAAEKLIRASRQLAPPSAPVDAEPATVRDLQDCDALPPDWAVVDFWRLEHEVVLAFVVTRRGLTCHRLAFPAEDKEFSQRLDRLLRSIRHTETAPDDDGLDELGQYLVVPLLAALRREGVRGLYLVPHGYLNALPLHAARWYEHGRPVYLCEAFDVAYLPAANLLLTLPPTDWTGGVLSLANPNRHEKGTLPFADWEGRQLREQFGAGGRYFLGADATPGATDDWSDCGLLHFSCHGTGDESFAPLARLMLRGDPLLALDVMHRRARLKEGAHVILNGCETGVRDWRAADESLGLMTAFLLRGAGTVLATQWCVNDASAAVFTLDYLTHLRAGAKPIVAIREARRRVRGMATDEVVRTSDRVVATFPEAAYPLEAAKSHFQAGIAAHWAENEPKAKTHFATAERLLKDQGMSDEAERIAALLRSPRTGAHVAELHRVARFDHPVRWGAFHLIGRVT